MPHGLTSYEAQQRLTQYGYNELTEVSKTTPLKILLRQIRSNFIIYMLAVTVVISFFVGKSVTAYTILAVIISVILVGFIQEYKAEESINSLRKMLMPVSIVFRDNKKTELPSREIVPDDVLILGNGEKIPADCELIETYELRVNESALTGESKEIKKSMVIQGKPITDENKIFMGTFIVNGRCLARVTHTGMNTSFGKIAHLISTAEKELPLQEKINDIAKYMVAVATITSIVTGMIMVQRAPLLDSESIIEILILVIALAVSAFPEGFPVVLATTLALGAKRMSEKNAIVNRMSIIETLGEVTVICSDKTGTITRGEMTVKFIFTGNALYEVSGSGYVAHGNITLDGKAIVHEKEKGIYKMIKAGILCNNSEIERTGEDNEYRGMGSPTETSLLILGAKTGLFRESFDYLRINEYTFNSDRKMMSILYDQNGKRIVYAKGAPEIILEKCNRTYDNGNIKTLSKEDINKIADLQREMAKSAFRTLALCYKEVEGVDENYEEDEFVFLGIVAMEDSPREEVGKAIKTAMRAGINVYMITGDSRETALSIANQIGLDTSDRVLDGQEIDQLSDKELEVKVREVNLFARVKPEHKIRLVRIFKEMGETVAMTGDGVNDAPALKEAHVGIAMGKNGTDVSRSSADLILKDDNFATIVSAITEGRTVFNNIRKFVTYQLSCNLAEILTLLVGVIVAPIFGWYTPLLVSIQILFMNLVTDNLPALTLGLNPTSIDIMEEKPRNTENILNKELIKLLITTASFMAVSVLSAYYVSHNVLGLSTDVSRTTALLTFILIEISTAFSFRSFRKFTLNRSPLVNKHLVIASLASMLFTILIIYTPLNVIFETVQIGPLEWTIAIIFNLIMMFFNDITKIINLKNESYLADTR